MTCEKQMLSLPLKSFSTKFCECITPLVKFLSEDLAKLDNKWVRLLPFKEYSPLKELGYCLRTDIIITENNDIKITEMDFVAMGRCNVLIILEGRDDLILV